MVEIFDMANDQLKDKVAAIEIPSEYPHPIVLYLRKRIVMLWAKTKEEQEIWASKIKKEVSGFRLQELGPLD